jgi:hypothetical protein
MRGVLWLLAGIIFLYLASALALQAIYGQSYGFLSGEDCWRPDGHGGWVKHGNPSDPPPAEASSNIPLLMNYLPIFLPGFLLALFLFTPLRHKLEPPPEVDTEPGEDSDATSDEG